MDETQYRLKLMLIHQNLMVISHNHGYVFDTTDRFVALEHKADEIEHEAEIVQALKSVHELIGNIVELVEGGGIEKPPRG